MASTLVRTAFRTFLADTIGAADSGALYELPIIDSVNAFTVSMPASCVTLEFPPTHRERIAIGTPGTYRESGAVEISVITPAGVGDAAALAIADALTEAFTDAALEGVRVLSVQPPFSALSDNGRFYVSTVAVEFETV